MQVKLSSEYLKNNDKKTRLNKEKIYTVLAIEIYHSGVTKYRIESDEAPIPILFPIEMFEIISNNLPSTWRAMKIDNVGINFEPESWMNAGFWEDYFNDDENAIQIYIEERDKILQED